MSGRKQVVPGNQVSSDQALSASFTVVLLSTVFTLDNVGVNVSTSGVTTNTGTFSVQHRIKKDDNPGNQSAWATLTLSSVPTLANADTTFLIDLNQVPPGELRLVFTPGGGTPNGTCDVWVSGCSLGA